MVSRLTRAWIACAARRRHVVLGQAEVGQRRAGGDLQLQPHQVEAGDLLGDRVLHLQPRIGLDEDEARRRRRRPGTRWCRGSR